MPICFVYALRPDPHYSTLNVQRFYSSLRKAGLPVLTSQTSQVEALRWAHIKTLTPLVRQYNEALNKDKDPRLRRSQFPLNASEFRRMSDKEMQYKIAKILTQDIAGQDRLLQQYGWSFEKLKPVDDECVLNVSPRLVSAMLSKEVLSVM